ncbi:MAG: alpha/beta fold hydrolase, partial [Marinilabiliales bacterium]|nr:alpha/beta fold hydrolase [Marinilabiliales bacterium]
MILHYRKYGEGNPNLVILHGLYGASDNWISIARKLENHYTIWLPDLRNHGSSPHLPTHTYRDLVQDVADFFQQHELNEVILLGHSMGGKVAMLLASEYPEYIRHLVVVDIAP